MLSFKIITAYPEMFPGVLGHSIIGKALKEKKIKTAVNNSAEVARNYVAQARDSIEADILLMVIDINNQSTLFYENPKQFLNVLTTQRLLRRLDEVHY